MCSARRNVITCKLMSIVVKGINLAVGGGVVGRLGRVSELEFAPES